uniref:DM domain-containing protein n=1 Tax=Rhabditophanes sp. KR3021 TaxID=114890 RepID=A0AC35UAS2_9BILA
MPKEQYMCQLCCNHNIFNQPKKGHKSKCPYRNCGCNACGLNTKRRALDQIERKLRVKKSPSPQPSSPNSHLNYPPQQFQMSQNLVSPTNANINNNCSNCMNGNRNNSLDKMGLFKKDFPLKAFVDTAIHGTIGSVGDVICINMGIYSQIMRNFFKESIEAQNGGVQTSDVFLNNAFSVFSASDIIGNFAIGAIYVYLIKFFGSLDVWVYVRHLMVQIAMLCMLLAKLTNLYQLAIISRFMLGGSMFFGVTESLFVAECGGDKYKDTLLLNLITYYTIVGMLLTVFAHDSLFGNEQSWVYLYILGSVVSIIYLIYTIRIHESPKEIYINGKNPKLAEKSLKYYRGKNVNVKEVFDEYNKEMVQQKDVKIFTILEAIKCKKLRTTLLLILGVTTMTSISFYIVVRPYLQIIYLSYGASVSTSAILHMSFQITGITTSIGAPWLYSNVGHKKILTFYMVMIVGTFGTIIMAEFMNSKGTTSIIPLVLCAISLLADRGAIGLGRSQLGTILMTSVEINKKDAVAQLTTIVYNVVLILIQSTYLQLFEVLGIYLYLFYMVLIIALYSFIIIYWPKDITKVPSVTLENGNEMEIKEFIPQ